VLLRYKKAADWQLISEIVAANGLPIIGNGDILTHYEAADRYV
jgi:tRNA-dihydrouridine synthase 3